MMPTLLFLFILPFISITNAKPYDDALARKIFPLSAAAYTPNPTICIGNTYKNAEMIQRYEPKCDPLNVTTCSGFLAVLHSEQVIAVVFRGTIDNAQLGFEAYADYAPKFPFEKMGGVQNYFFGAFWYVWNSGMGTKFDELTKKYPSYGLWVSGHSLGGALSSLASAKIAKDYPKFTKDNTAFYNFGQPAIGDKDFAAAHDKLLPDFWRVTHSRDIIIKLPDPELNFVHHNTEVWYNNTMAPGSKYVLCADVNDKKCERKFDSTDDHTHYFGVSVYEFGIKGCSTGNNKHDDSSSFVTKIVVSTSLFVVSMLTNFI